MKKALQSLLIALFLLAAFPVSSAFAYTGGLLNGKTLNVGDFSTNNVISTSTQATDNNTSTSVTLGYNITNCSCWLWYDLNNNYNLTNVYKKLGNDNIYMFFYDKNKSLIGSNYNLSAYPNDNVTVSANGVRYVAIKNTATNVNGSIFEFDVFGSLTNPLPTLPSGLSATADNENVSLVWSSVSSATSYSVKRSMQAGGPYSTIATDVTGTTYLDISVTKGYTYYYVVTAVNAGGESGNSNEASATLAAPVADDRALVVITLVNGLEKEYDLSMTEVNSFINWYNGRAEGTGSEVYTFNKTFNLANFLSRKDYVAFSKIETFEVNEYKVNTP